MRDDGHYTFEEASELLDLEYIITTGYNFSQEFQSWLVASLIVIQRECQDQRRRHVPMLEILSAVLTTWNLAPSWQSEGIILADTIYFLKCD